MPVRRRKDSPYFQIRFTIAGITVRRTARTATRREAEQLEQELRRDLWRQIQLGEKRFTWDDAVARLRQEHADNPQRWRAFERTERVLEHLTPLLAGSQLVELADKENLLRVRRLLAARTWRGAPVAPATVNREMAELGKILNLAADEWGMLDARVPTIPLFRLDKVEPVWATREQVTALLAGLPEHSRDLAIVACATGMRRGEVARMQWAHVDERRATCYVPASGAKNRQARVVPLNADALAILAKWREPRGKVDPFGPHPTFVFYFRRRAPIARLTTRAFHRAATAAGLPGFTFHKLRHTWASWQVQSGTPLKILMELGGWNSYEMVIRYAHLAPGHLAQYADRSLLDPAQKVAQADSEGDEETRKSLKSGGKGGTRTLDPGIMSSGGERQAEEDQEVTVLPARRTAV